MWGVISVLEKFKRGTQLKGQNKLTLLKIFERYDFFTTFHTQTRSS